MTASTVVEANRLINISVGVVSSPSLVALCPTGVHSAVTNRQSGREVPNIALNMSSDDDTIRVQPHTSYRNPDLLRGKLKPVPKTRTRENGQMRGPHRQPKQLTSSLQSTSATSRRRPVRDPKAAGSSKITRDITYDENTQKESERLLSKANMQQATSAVETDEAHGSLPSDASSPLCEDSREPKRITHDANGPPRQSSARNGSSLHRRPQMSPRLQSATFQTNIVDDVDHAQAVLLPKKSKRLASHSSPATPAGKRIRRDYTPVCDDGSIGSPNTSPNGDQFVVETPVQQSPRLRKEHSPTTDTGESSGHRSSKAPQVAPSLDELDLYSLRSNLDGFNKGMKALEKCALQLGRSAHSMLASQISAHEAMIRDVLTKLDDLKAGETRRHEAFQAAQKQQHEAFQATQKDQYEAFRAVQRREHEAFQTAQMQYHENFEAVLTDCIRILKNSVPGHCLQ